MKTITQKLELMKISNDWQRSGKTIGFVPTMGALHAGHLHLVTEAQKICDKIVVSIFVNPTQFGPTEDFAKYPRPISDDILLLEKANVDLLFAPSVPEVYGENCLTTVSTSQLSQVLCGKSRPGHFDGVCTIVAKLFNMVDPDAAFFGKKDFQQFTIISQLTKDLDFKAKIIGIETLRDPSGVALSSRNRYLTPHQLLQAAKIYEALKLVKQNFFRGVKDANKLIQIFTAHLDDPIFEVEYCEIRHPATLQLLVGNISTPAQIFTAVKVGATRLIDNLSIN